MGIQPIWTRFGRHVVGNLTTVTNSVRDFTTLLLGYYFAEELAGELEPGTEVGVFLKWEQLAAYSRYLVNKEGAGLRGIERVQKWGDGKQKIVISDKQECQILSNQKTYGLWGLYTMPARTSGLVDAGQPRLTLEAKAFVEKNYLPLLAAGAGKNARSIRELLKRKSTPLVRNDRLFPTVAKLMEPKISAQEREFYRTHLVEGGPQDGTSGRQRLLAGLLESTFSDETFRWSPASVDALAKDARHLGTEGERLAGFLKRIQVCESVLAPVSMLFSYLLGLHDQPVNSVSKLLRERWGDGLGTVDPRAFEELASGETSKDLGDDESSRRWRAIAAAAAAGRYGELLDLLMEQNAAVMKTRDGAAWIEKRNKSFHVRVKDERGDHIPSNDELRSVWRFPYFLDSLRQIAQAL